MRNKKTFIGIVLIIAVLLVGIGYAEVTNKTLNISGKATATPDSGNFVVKFTDDITVSDTDKVSATKTSDIEATINVSGLTAKGDTATATYTILNDSADLSADLTADVTNSDTTNFEVTYEFEETNIAATKTTTVTVTVKLLTTPIDSNLEADVTVELTASPVQPTV